MYAALVAEAAARFGDKVAFANADGSDAVSFRGLEPVTDGLAARLAARGVREGQVVALVLPPSVAYPLLYIALAKLGAATAGVTTRLPATQRALLLDVIAPDLVIDEDVVAGGLDVLRVDGASPPPLASDPERPVAICSTSGTTGEPRACVFGARQIDAITAIDVGDAWGGGGVALTGTSFAHLGPMTKLAGSLRRGTSTYVLREWRAETALALSSRLGVTSIGGIPTQVALLLARPEFDATDLSSVRLVVMGGGPATPALVRDARARFGVPVCVRYSCTEAGIGCGTSPTDDDEDAEISVGRPQPGVELAIRDGEVLIRSAAVTSGYRNDPDATAALFTDDGFVRTGDLGWIDDRGRLRLTGRIKEMYVRGGENVYPMAVEAVLADHPDVRDLAVVPVPDDVMGEIGVAVVVPRAGHEPPTVESLRDFGAAALGRHELPERVLVTDALPLTAGDKVDRRALREWVSIEREGGA